MRKSDEIRYRLAILSVAAIGLIAAPSFGFSTRLLVWNPTKSVPRGLYVRVSSPISRGDYVLAWPPAIARELAHERGYLPRTVPALKPVAATAGDEVCAAAERISVNGVHLAGRRLHDSEGRDLPRWTECKTLTAGQVFLLSDYASDSFDGRYFGVSEPADIIEKVAPAWTFP